MPLILKLQPFIPLLQELGVSSPGLDELVLAALEAGALGATRLIGLAVYAGFSYPVGKSTLFTDLWRFGRASAYADSRQRH